MNQFRRALQYAVLTLALGCGAAGCRAAGGPRLVDALGTYGLGGDLELRVSARGMTLVEYELRDLPTGRVLASDVCGRDVSRWFLYYDGEGRLWVHSNDVGTEVWVPTAVGGFDRHPVLRGSHFARQVPAEVTERLPNITRKSLGIAAAEPD